MGEVVGKAQLAHEHGEDRVEAEDRVGEARVVLHGRLYSKLSFFRYDHF